MRGDLSLILLNVTAEAWLEVFLRGIGEAGLCPAMFKSIEKDEARHARLALDIKIPDPRRSIPIMRELESHLEALMREPEFMLPLIYLVGLNKAAELGIQVIKAHKRACKHLHIPISDKIQSVNAMLRQSLRSNEPVKLELSAWQKWRIQGFSGRPGPMETAIDVPDSSLMEYKLAQACSKALRISTLNKTIANNCIYQCTTPFVGLRRRALQGIYTIYIANADSKSLLDVMKDSREANNFAKTQPYCEIREWHQFENMMPPSKYAVVISNTGAFDGCYGSRAPLWDMEGATYSLTIDKPVWKPFKRKFLPWPKWKKMVRVAITADHRVIDGNDLALFTHEILRYFNGLKEL